MQGSGRTSQWDNELAASCDARRHSGPPARHQCRETSDQEGSLALADSVQTTFDACKLAQEAGRTSGAPSSCCKVFDISGCTGWRAGLCFSLFPPASRHSRCDIEASRAGAQGLPRLERHLRLGDDTNRSVVNWHQAFFRGRLYCYRKVTGPTCGSARVTYPQAGSLLGDFRLNAIATSKLRFAQRGASHPQRMAATDVSVSSRWWYATPAPDAANGAGAYRGVAASDSSNGGR